MTKPTLSSVMWDNSNMTDIVERIASRIHDAPLPTEYLLDEAKAEIVRLRGELQRARGLLTLVLHTEAVTSTECETP